MKKVLSLLTMMALILVFSMTFDVSDAHAATTTASGNLTDKISWKLTDTGTFTISGSGRIKYPTSLDREDRIARWEKYAPKAKKLVISSGITGWDEGTLKKFTKITSLTIAGSVEKIRASAFYGKNVLTSVTLKEGVEEIDEEAFMACKKLSSVSLPDSLEVIGDQAFYATGITEILIPKGVETICSDAFGDCPNLKYVEFENGIKHIQRNAFRECSSLQKIVFPKSLKSLDSGIFIFCDQEINVCFRGNPPEVDDAVFNDNKIIAFYPKNNTYWTEKVRNKFANSYSDIEWKPYDASVLTRPEIKLGNSSTSGKNTISWHLVPAASKYEVYRSTSSSGTYTKLGTFRSLKITNTSAKPGYKYYYKVRAVDSDGKKSNYSTIKYRYCDCATPVVKVSNRVSDGKPTLTWSAVDGASSYEIYRSSDEEGTYKKTFTTSKTSYINTSAVSGKTYYYKVKAICKRTSSGNSALSKVYAGKCLCARPKVTVHLDEDSQKPVLIWDSVSKAKEYIVYRATKENGTYYEKAKVTGTSFTDETAKSDKTYYYKVKAKPLLGNNDTYTSAYSLPVKIVL